MGKLLTYSSDMGAAMALPDSKGNEMFNVEYRTISSGGNVHPSQIAVIGAHKAQSADEAAAYVLFKFGRVKIVRVEFVGSM